MVLAPRSSSMVDVVVDIVDMLSLPPSLTLGLIVNGSDLGTQIWQCRVVVVNRIGMDLLPSSLPLSPTLSGYLSTDRDITQCLLFLCDGLLVWLSYVATQAMWCAMHLKSIPAIFSTSCLLQWWVAVSYKSSWSTERTKTIFFQLSVFF
jgi:hypothetical protein